MSLHPSPPDPERPSLIFFFHTLSSLESCLRNFSCLTRGDIFSVSYNSIAFEFLVMETQPEGPGISCQDTDLEVRTFAIFFLPLLDCLLNPDRLLRSNMRHITLFRSISPPPRATSSLLLLLPKRSRRWLPSLTSTSLLRRHHLPHLPRVEVTHPMQPRLHSKPS